MNWIEKNNAMHAKQTAPAILKCNAPKKTIGLLLFDYEGIFVQ